MQQNKNGLICVQSLIDGLTAEVTPDKIKGKTNKYPIKYEVEE